MFKSTLKREIFKEETKKQTPAPGQYTTGPTAEEIQDDMLDPFKRTAVFMSTTGRAPWYDLPSKNNPAPGNYAYETTFKKHFVPDKMQNFGSTSLRSFDMPKHVILQQNFTPGPGTYIDPQTNVQQQAPPAVHGPFLSTTDRFMEKEPELTNLGPGVYDKAIDSELVRELKRKQKLAGTYGVFGTTSKRFIKQKTTMPGPGAYTMPTPKEPVRKNDKRSGVFASVTRRETIQPKQHDEVPPVGIYDVKMEPWVKEKKVFAKNKFADPKADHIFMSSVPLHSGGFVEHAVKLSKNTPGPGSYQPREGKPIKSAPAQSLSISPRFKDAPKSTLVVPGPGKYTFNEQMVKRTFNVSFM